MDGFYQLAFLALALASAACAPYAIVAAADGRLSKGLLLILVGVLAATAALLSSFKIGAEGRALEKVKEGPIHNDMPGFGQALLGGFALLYFAATAVVVIVVSSVVKYRRGKKLLNPKAFRSK
jgi:hypothetical protein